MFIRGAALLLLISMAACGGSNPTTGPTPTPSPTPAVGATRTIGLVADLAFGNVTVGQTATRTLTITNSGNSTLTISGLTAPGLSVYSADWTNGTISAGRSQFVTIGFIPTAAATYSGTLTVHADQTGGADTIPISGRGVSASIGTYNWAASGSPQFCSVNLCLDFTGSATNLGSGCATNVWFHVEFYTKEFGTIFPDVLVFPADSSPTAALVRAGQTITFQTGTVFNPLERHLIGSFITTNYTRASCP